MNPTGLFDVAQTALDCVCEQMDALAAEVEEYPGCPCLQYVSAGEPTIDCCTGDCESSGMVTVHIEDVFPSETFPQPSPGFEPCKAATWVASLVVTAARCSPEQDEQATDASMEDLTANARLMALDQYAAFTALGCCLVADSPPNKSKRRVQIQGSRPVTTSGGCAAVEVRAFVEMGQVCACTSGS